MKCTNCNKVITPVVAIDIDGTLGDYHSHFLKFASEYLGHDIQSYRPLYNGRQSFKEWFMLRASVSEAVWHDIKLTYRQGAQKRSVPVYDGAARLTQAVVLAGAELWLTTTRPYMRLDNIDPDTQFWLKRNGIMSDGFIYDKLKYQKLAGIVGQDRVCVVLDDLVEELAQAQHALPNAKTILRGTEWNDETYWDDVAEDLKQAARDIKIEINSWKAAHDS